MEQREQEAGGSLDHESDWFLMVLRPDRLKESEAVMLRYYTVVSLLEQ